MACRILLADDSITIQKVVNLTFADEGIEVIAVSNGDIAERRLPEVSPDLVLADIFMPGKNGYELCEAIKENSQFRNIPVVLLVGAFEPFDQAEARRVGADAHLTKPFESRTLVETVQRLISASGQSTAGPIAAPLATDDEKALEALAPAVPPLPSQPPVKLDLSAMTTQSDAAPFIAETRTTGELASPAPAPPQDVLDLELVDAPTVEAASATMTSQQGQFEPLEISPADSFPLSESPMTTGMDSQEMIQDFERAELAAPDTSQDPISLEAESSSLLEVNISGAGDEEHWFKRGNFDTPQPDPASDNGRQTQAGGSPLNYQSAEFNLQAEGMYAGSEASNETACATLLAVDEPLGDVLSDESLSVGQISIPEPASSDALALDFPESEVVAPESPGSTQFDLIESVEPTSETSFAFVESPAENEPTAVEEPVGSIVEETVHEQQIESVADQQPADAETVSPETTDVWDWTTARAASHSTEQLESKVMPIDTVEYAGEYSVNEEASVPSENSATETAQEASFSSTTMWYEEEARFTPIDIEAVAVEETPTDQTGEAETGFAISSVLADEPAKTAEAPASAAETEVAAGAPGPVDLSSSAIEQIVRRVVAEMSESLVREVAWEVVPDCVERVIEQLTRESLSKRV